MKGVHLLIVVGLLLLMVVVVSGVAGSLFRSYNREGMTSSSSNNVSVWYGPHGEVAKLTTSNDNNQTTTTLVVTTSSGTVTTFSWNATTSVYVAPDGTTATVVPGSNGVNALKITYPTGEVVVFTNNTTTGQTRSFTSYDNYNHFSGTSYPVIYYGPNGGTARVIQTGTEEFIIVSLENGTTQIYRIQQGQTNANTASVHQYYGPNGGNATLVTDESGKYVVKVTDPNGTTTVYSSDPHAATTGITAETTGTSSYDHTNAYKSSYYNTGPAASTTYTNTTNTTTPPNNISGYDYSDSLPPGIPRSQIPPGEEDLYILKSEVVPPVCPKCPDPIVTSPSTEQSCPPCPPCARCPEPAFDCKKVPNYSAFTPDSMPMPVLSDFSSFGM